MAKEHSNHHSSRLWAHGSHGSQGQFSALLSTLQEPRRFSDREGWLGNEERDKIDVTRSHGSTPEWAIVSRSNLNTDEWAERSELEHSGPILMSS
jgi:hypothetical protein